MNVMAPANDTRHVRSFDSAAVRRLMIWMRGQGAERRGEAISALARALLFSPLPEAVRGDVMLALTGALDDPSSLVRRALAEALASAEDAPRHIVLALANDQADVSRIVLARSPLLLDAELVDCAAVGDIEAQVAIARRPHLGPGVAAAIAEVGRLPAALALLGNLEARIGAAALRRTFERFGEEAAVREALLLRPELPPALRADIAAATAAALGRFAVGCGWLESGRAEKIAREAREQTTVAIACDSDARDLPELIGRLRATGQLTVGLLMRALLSGDRSLFEAALADMSRTPANRVAGFVAQWSGQGFAAIYARAGMPDVYLPAFRAALQALRSEPFIPGERISLALVRRTLALCEAQRDPGLAPMISLLWRLMGEGARLDARDFTVQAVAPVVEPVGAAIALDDSRRNPSALTLDFGVANENRDIDSRVTPDFAAA